MENKQVEIVSINIPLKCLMLFMAKLAIASIPAVVILYLIIAWLYALLGDAVLQI